MGPEENHPYWQMRTLIDNEPIVEFLTLSYYVYRPQSLVDERTVIHVSRADFLDISFITRLIDRCPQNQDLAAHSLMQCNDDIARHIPMVDMSTNARAHLSKLRAFLDTETFFGFTWFESGRSFHGYGNHLLTHEQWISYMGQLLLSNQKDLKPTVDPRWIGHRLIAGYAALRWTRNTEHYLKLPQKISK
jgi:hypothetical protein